MSQQLKLPLQTTAELDAQQTAQVFTNVSEMQRRVPALFSTTAHPRMSSRYSFTNTYDIILSMHNRGYRVVSVMGGHSKFAKVLIRMRSADYNAGKVAYAPEAVVLDSHNGTSPLKLLLGAVSFACMNGIIAGDFLFARRYVHHTPNLMSQVRLDLDDLDKATEQLIQRITAMREYKTTLAERMLLADTAVKERFGEDKDGSFVAEMRHKLLEIRRLDDDSYDLYTTMNVVQENILRGGASYQTSNRLQHMRPITQVDRNVHINQALWLTAERIMSKALEQANAPV